MGIDTKKWLGWQDLNLRMTGSKPVALPLGDIPVMYFQLKLHESKLTNYGLFDCKVPIFVFLEQQRLANSGHIRRLFY